MGPHAACPDLDHNRDVRLDLCRGLDPCDLCHHQGPVPCVHEQYHGRTGPACAVLRLGRHYRSVSLLEALARAAPGTHRHEILVEGYSSGRARHGPYTLAAVTLILGGGIIASLIGARRTPESRHVKIPARRKLLTRRRR